MRFASDRLDDVPTEGGTRPRHGRQCVSRRTEQITYFLMAEQGREMVSNAYRGKPTRSRTLYGRNKAATFCSERVRCMRSRFYHKTTLTHLEQGKTVREYSFSLRSYTMGPLTS